MSQSGGFCRAVSPAAGASGAGGGVGRCAEVRGREGGEALFFRLPVRFETLAPLLVLPELIQVTVPEVDLLARSRADQCSRVLTVLVFIHNSREQDVCAAVAIYVHVVHREATPADE